MCGVHQGSRATRTVPAITLDVSRVHGARAPVEVSACDKADDDDVGAKSEARAHRSMRSDRRGTPRTAQREAAATALNALAARPSFDHEPHKSRIVATRRARFPGLAS